MFGIFKRKKPEEEKAQTEQGLKKTRAGFIDRMARFFMGTELSTEVWNEFEEALIAADVGMETSVELVERARARADREAVGRFDHALDIFRDEVEASLKVTSKAPVPWSDDSPDLPKPFVVLVVGVNGAGKTTSIGKLACYLAEARQKVLLAAADTFRAAAREQLAVWADRVAAAGGTGGSVEIVSQQGGDPAADQMGIDPAQDRVAAQGDVQVPDGDQVIGHFRCLASVCRLARMVRTYRSGVGVPLKPPASWLQNGTPDRPCDSPPRSVLAIAG